MCPVDDGYGNRVGLLFGTLVGALGTGCYHLDILRTLDTWIGICREERTEILQVDTVYLARVKGDERLGIGDEELTYGDETRLDRKNTRLNSSHVRTSRMPSSA